MTRRVQANAANTTASAPGAPEDRHGSMIPSTTTQTRSLSQQRGAALANNVLQTGREATEPSALTTVLGKSDSSVRINHPLPRADPENGPSTPTSPLRPEGHERRVLREGSPSIYPKGPSAEYPTSNYASEGGGITSLQASTASRGTAPGKHGATPRDAKGKGSAMTRMRAPPHFPSMEDSDGLASPPRSHSSEFKERTASQQATWTRSQQETGDNDNGRTNESVMSRWGCGGPSGLYESSHDIWGAGAPCHKRSRECAAALALNVLQSRRTATVPPALTNVLGRSDVTASGNRPQPRADSEDSSPNVPTSSLRALGHERSVGWGHAPTSRPMGPGGVLTTSSRAPDGGGASSARISTAPRSTSLERHGRSPDDAENNPGPRIGRHRTTQSSRDRACIRMVIAIHRTPGEISVIREEDEDLLDPVDLLPDEIHESGLRGLGREGITRWVKFTLGRIVIAHAMVLDAENSPALSCINAYDAIIGGAQLGPLLGPANSTFLGEGHEIRVHWGGGDNPETWILWPLQPRDPLSALFTHPTLAIGTGRMNFLPDEDGTLDTHEHT